MIGRTIGKYRILEKLGRGGMGTVYKAVDETLGRNVAVKVLNPELAETDVMKRFEAEARALAKLNHPEIATIHEIHRSNADVLMVMEYVSGETLDDLLKRSGPLPPERAAYLVAQILGALAHAHGAGVVHRDLKPSNVMVTETGAVKILDFGIARVAGVERMTAVGFMVGTPAYMSPESIMGTEVDGRADLYSAGVLFYRLITGHLPFQAENPTDMVQKQLSEPPTPARAYRQDLPEWCDAILNVALAKTPAERFQSAEAYRSALLNAMASGENEQTGLFTAPQVAKSQDQPPSPPAPAIDQLTVATPAPAPGGASVSEAGLDDLTMAVGLPVPDAIGSTALTPTLAAIPQVESTDRMPFVTPSGIGRSPAPSSGVPPVHDEMADATRRVAALPAVGDDIGVTIASATPPATNIAASMATTAVLTPPASIASAPTGTTLVLPRKQFAIAGIVLAALVLAVLVLVVVVLRRSASTVVSPATSESAQATTPASPAPSSQDPAAVAAPTAPPLELSEPPLKIAPAAAPPDLPRSAATPPPAGSRRATPVEPAAPVPTHPPPTDTTPFRFEAKAVVAEGDKRRERDASVLIAEGSITVTQKSDAVLYVLPVDALTSVTMSNSRQPLWESPSGPAEAMKVESGAFGFLRGGRNWLGLRTNDALLFLRVDDDIVGRVIAGLQTRTGLTVARLAEPKE